MYKTDVETNLSEVDLSPIGNDLLDSLFPFQKIGVQLVIFIYCNYVVYSTIMILNLHLGLEYRKKAAALSQMTWAWERPYKL